MIAFHSETGQVLHLNPRYLQRPEASGGDTRHRAARVARVTCLTPAGHLGEVWVCECGPSFLMRLPTLTVWHAPCLRVNLSQVIESIFYMWRATHDRRWRDMGWQMWRAVQAHCRWEGGYSGALNATQVGGPSRLAQLA